MKPLPLSRRHEQRPRQKHKPQRPVDIAEQQIPLQQQNEDVKVRDAACNGPAYEIGVVDGGATG